MFAQRRSDSDLAEWQDGKVAPIVLWVSSRTLQSGVRGSEISDKFSMAAAAEFEGSGTRILRDPEFEFTKTLEPR